MFVFNSMSHTFSVSALPMHSYTAAMLGTCAWDVGHWVAPARNPLQYSSFKPSSAHSSTETVLDALLEGEAYKGSFTPSWFLPHSCLQALFLLSRVVIKSKGTCFPQGPSHRDTLFYSILSTAVFVSASCSNVSQSLTANGARNEVEMSPSPGLKG